jgi:phosphopentomutase
MISMDDMENIYIKTDDFGKIQDTFMHTGCEKSSSSDHVMEVLKVWCRGHQTCRVNVIFVNVIENIISAFIKMQLSLINLI